MTTSVLYSLSPLPTYIVNPSLLISLSVISEPNKASDLDKKGEHHHPHIENGTIHL